MKDICNIIILQYDPAKPHSGKLERYSNTVNTVTDFLRYFLGTSQHFSSMIFIEPQFRCKKKKKNEGKNKKKR